MSWREVLRIALRYSFAFGRGHLSTFLSSLSTLGLILAITLLITVLSVMNGFDKEMRERILALVPHVSLLSHQPVTDWETIARDVRAHPGVSGVQAFVDFDALFLRGSAIETARGLGLPTPSVEARRGLLAALPDADYAAFASDPRGLVLGAALAARLGASAGDALTLIVPDANTARSGAARFEALTLRAVLDTGTELDEATAVVALPLASQLAGLDGAVDGLQLGSVDIFDAPRLGWELLQVLPPGFYATNWMQSHGNLYSAIQLSRDLVAILLFSIIAVAAFNVVSSLVLVVFDKRGDVAILRTLGARRRHVAAVFVLQGGLIGATGVLLGCGLGVLSSHLVPVLVAYLEQLLGVRFLDTDVYPVSFLPVEVLPGDVVLVGLVAFLMCILAAIYPALRAARQAPAVTLHQQGA